MVIESEPHSRIDASPGREFLWNARGYLTREVPVGNGDIAYEGMQMPHDRSSAVIAVGINTLIDAGSREGVPQMLNNRKAAGKSLSTIETVILTHPHLDHLEGLFDVRNAIRAHGGDPRILAYKGTRELLSSGNTNITLEEHYLSFLDRKDIDDIEDILEEGSVIETDVGPLRVLWTPGHTDLHISLLAEKQRALITGDIMGAYLPGQSNLELMRFSAGRMLEYDWEHTVVSHDLTQTRKQYENTYEKLALTEDELVPGKFLVQGLNNFAADPTRPQRTSTIAN